MKIIATALICFLLVNRAWSQQSEIDSLERALKNQQLADTLKIDALNNLAYDYSMIKPVTGLKYADKAILLAGKVQAWKQLGTAYNYKAMNYAYLGKDSLALSNYMLAITTAQRYHNKKGEAVGLNNMAILYTNRSEYQKALEARLRALAIFKQLKNNQGINILNTNIAVNYMYMADYPRSLATSFQALAFAQNKDNGVLDGQGEIYLNIGLVYKKLKLYAKAIKYYQQGLAIYKAAGNKIFAANTLDNIGSVYDDMGQPHKALKLYEQALRIAQEVDYKHGEASYLTDIGIVLNSMGKYTAASQKLNAALAICKASPDDNISAVIFTELAELLNKAPADSLLALGYTIGSAKSRATDYAHQAIKLSASAQLPEREMNGWDVLSRVHETHKEYEDALTAYKKYAAIKDSIFNDEKRIAIQNSEVKFVYDKKEALQKVEIDRQKFIRNTIIACSVVGVLLALLIFVSYKKHRDVTQVQRELLLKAQISDVEMRVLRLQLNPHFIFNSLNSISDYIGKNDIKTADYFLVKFARLMRATLENSEEKEITLAEELHMIELYMQLEAARLSHKFSYRITVAADIDTQTTMVPPLILQPFVENCIWHGLVNKEGEGMITIEINRDSALLNCVVEDDGVGRGQTAGNQTKKSYGVKISRDRIALLNKLNNTQASINLIDLDKGTRVEIKLPLETEN